jgi:hypothetical protein
MGERERADPRRSERLSSKSRVAGVVFDQQDFKRCIGSCVHTFNPDDGHAAGRYDSAGSVKQNSDPPSAGRSTQIRPP